MVGPRISPFNIIFVEAVFVITLLGTLKSHVILFKLKDPGN